MTSSSGNWARFVRSDILAGVAGVIEDLVGTAASEVTENQAFRDDLGIDSLTMVEMIVRVGQEFDLRIPDAEVGNFRTVGDLVDYVVEWHTDR